MTPDDPGDARLSLQLERVLPASPALVFRLHTEPDELARWWGPRGFSAPSVEIDLRIGGRYRIEMQPPAGDPFHVAGEFREITPAHLLVYTFRYEEPDPDDRETVVTFTLRARDTSTAVTVEQGRFATDARRELHVQGWSDTLDRLQELVGDAGRA